MTQLRTEDELALSRVGLGTWVFGAGRQGSSGLGPQEDDDSVATIVRALELGINWIDTAAGYGVGHAEQIVARALRRSAERPYVLTKCGALVVDGAETYCLQRDSIRDEVEAILERLGVDALDLVQIHHPRPDSELEEGWAALAELRSEGRIRRIGASNFSVAQLERVAAIDPVAVVQTKYSLLHRGAELELLPYCREHGIPVLAYSTLYHGLLSGALTAQRIATLPATDWRSGQADFTEPRLSRHLAIVERLGVIAQAHGATPSHVAIAWALRHPAVTGAIVGARRPAQIEELVDAQALELDDDEAAELRELASA